MLSRVCVGFLRLIDRRSSRSGGFSSHVAYDSHAAVKHNMKQLIRRLLLCLVLHVPAVTIRDRQVHVAPVLQTVCAACLDLVG